MIFQRWIKNVCVTTQVIFLFFIFERNGCNERDCFNETFAIREKRHFNVEFGGRTTIIHYYIDHQTSCVQQLSICTSCSAEFGSLIFIDDIISAMT